uniref:Uncharacterized protein n=1 Tax=Chromera velia CCMP2878 TaxID=1169474 RepID=A0A0G4HUM7_9ALVE|eukprot:Cvel_8664.t1-p1 / transcript=Cvel_8664.t1 / gene=Cvel_8664 / organism=Chromera_velia_CCMP2878 / gene_product=UDP-glycosyltransferase 84A3, putative / transcript_product=UDP-glycosyltransferase 84A3, putative / location=Cvel_scaffold483:47575-50997(-) / protein_length=636 / sequence_SO=supercontig / SO=protein_coding / is_pseudo=false
MMIGGCNGLWLALFAICASPLWAAHYCIVVMESSHVVPMIGLSKELISRGHQVSFAVDEAYMTKVRKQFSEEENKKIVHYETHVNFREHLKKKGPEDEEEFRSYISMMPYWTNTLLPMWFIPNMFGLISAEVLINLKETLRKEPVDSLPDAIVVDSFVPFVFDLDQKGAIAQGKRIKAINFISTDATYFAYPYTMRRHPIATSSLRHSEYHSSLPLQIGDHLIQLLNLIVSYTYAPLMYNYVRWTKGLPSSEWNAWSHNFKYPTISVGAPGLSRPVSLPPHIFQVGPMEPPQNSEAKNSIAVVAPEVTQRVSGLLSSWSAEGKKVVYTALGTEASPPARVVRGIAAALGGLDDDFAALWAASEWVEKQLRGDPEAFEYVREKEEKGLLKVERFVPQKAVLSHPAVVCFFSHGGWNSLNEALLLGKPLVMLPFFGDQPANSVLLEEKGAAVALSKFMTPAEMRERVTGFLSDAERLANAALHAKRLGGVLRKAGGSTRGADLLEWCGGGEGTEDAVDRVGGGAYCEDFVDPSDAGSNPFWSFLGPVLSGWLARVHIDLWIVDLIVVYALYLLIRLVVRCVFACVRFVFSCIAWVLRCGNRREKSRAVSKQQKRKVEVSQSTSSTVSSEASEKTDKLE